MNHNDLSKRILVSITGRTEKDWRNKLNEIENLKIHKIALFLEMYPYQQRKKIYKNILESCILDIPLVHIRNDMKIDELIFLKENFNTKCFTIHETSFRYLQKWRGFYKHLFLEMDFNNYIPLLTNVKKIGGFCIDLSHYQASKDRSTLEFNYIKKREHYRRYFICNHLNGYSFRKKQDIHMVRHLTNFDYLRNLPLFLFGKFIALEMFNSIRKQLKFKDYIIELLKK